MFGLYSLLIYYIPLDKLVAKILIADLSKKENSSNYFIHDPNLNGNLWSRKNKQQNKRKKEQEKRAISGRSEKDFS